MHGADEEPSSLEMLEEKLWMESVFFFFWGGVKGKTPFIETRFAGGNHRGCEDKEHADAKEEEMVSVRF